MCIKLSLVSLIVIICTGYLYCQQNESLIHKIDRQLTRGQTTISNILSDVDYIPFHSQTAFREVIKKNAKAGKLIIINKNEPGTQITVKGEIKQKGKPVADALVYVYQTSDKGWYADTAAHVLQNEGDMRHARLFGYLKTGSDGKFEFETIQPRGYPNSDLPAHIHIAVWKNDKLVEGMPGELLFDDDPRLTPERRRRSLGEGFLIEKNKGTTKKPVYFYSIAGRE